MPPEVEASAPPQAALARSTEAIAESFKALDTTAATVIGRLFAAVSAQSTRLTALELRLRSARSRPGPPGRPPPGLLQVRGHGACTTPPIRVVPGSIRDIPGQWLECLRLQVRPAAPSGTEPPRARSADSERGPAAAAAAAGSRWMGPRPGQHLPAG